MNYERAYKEALERARESYRKSIEQGWTCDKEIYEQIFPELRDSEDERIGKEIIQFLQLPHPQFVGKRDHEKWITWLEKKGEQEHSWNEEDEGILLMCSDAIAAACAAAYYTTEEMNKMQNWLKSLKPHWKPSEEQMEALIKRTQGLHTNSETRKVLESLIFDLQEKL